MIVFDLQCSNEHCFEGWFDDRQSFEQQKEQGLIECPICSDRLVSLSPSTFGIRSSAGGNQLPAQRQLSENMPDLAAIGKKVAEFVEKNFDDVGCNFAKEALKIHYGAAEPRNIRGVSSAEEEKTLRKEGVSFVKVPMSVPSNPSEPSDGDA